MYSNGTVYVLPPSIITTSCKLNVNNYPFDQKDLFVSNEFNKKKNNEEFERILNKNYFKRERRRISVLKNFYQQCRIQKRKGKDLCLYLANLYQNVKGFHGI